MFPLLMLLTVGCETPIFLAMSACVIPSETRSSMIFCQFMATSIAITMFAVKP